MGQLTVKNTKLQDVKIITPKVFGDNRGFFEETYSDRDFKEAGIDFNFVQDNQSLSCRAGVLRGLHFQRGKAAHPKSPISEQFRTLRTNISFMAIDNPIKTLALTSASVSEGKSTVTDNLAVVWAQTGQKVLLVDTDLRRSTLHRTFDLDNREGLPMVLLEAV